MGPGRIPALVLGASLLFCGCRTADPIPGMAPALAEEPGADGAPEPEAPAKPVETGARWIASAWGLDGRVRGHVEGSPRDVSAGATGVPGASFEWRSFSRGEDPESWKTTGYLFEHFRAAGDRSVPGGRARAEGALTGAYLTSGFARRPYRDGKELPEDFAYRVDFLLGLRRGFALAEVPDGSGGSYRRSSTWGELALGMRAEFSPVRRVFLFVRGDLGSELNPRSFLDDEEYGGDSAVGATSCQFVAGLRVRPADHVSLLLGWRYLRLEGKELYNGFTEDRDTARVSWSGPWAGVEVDF